jgi:protein-tyrosine phosphatase
MAVMTRPRAGEWLEDSIAGWKKEGIQLVISLLEPDEADKLGLIREAELCQKFSLTFISHPFAERGVPPSPEETGVLVQTLKFQLQSRKNIAIHCHSAMGRSAMIAACVLRSFGVEATKAFQLVASARGFMVPDTKQQREWVEQFALAPAA